jgi:hypothetical protein
MPKRTLRADARTMPEANADADFWLISTMEKLRETYAAFMTPPPSMENDDELCVKLEECKFYLEVIDRTPANGKTGRTAKEKAFKICIGVYGGDIDTALGRECHGSLRSLSVSLARDILRLDAA